MEKNDLDFLNDHSPEFIEMAYNYDRMERLTDPDGYGKRTGDCGDTVEMFLSVDKDETITNISINIDGCVNTTACANTVAHLTEGSTISEAWEISPEQVADYLKTLEEDHFHCAELAVGAFFLSLSNYWELKKNGWKKSYQNKKLNRMGS